MGALPSEPIWGTRESSFPEYIIIFTLCAVAFVARSVKNVFGLASLEYTQSGMNHSTYGGPEKNRFNNVRPKRGGTKPTWVAKAIAA